MIDNELLKKRRELNDRVNGNLERMDEIITESQRVAVITGNSERIFNEIEKEFESQTGLNNIDRTFLFMAIAMQCARQYLLSQFRERVDHQTAAKETKGNKEHSKRSYFWYNPSLEDIINNPVPFDAIFGSPNFNLKIGGGFNHRAKTLGHDPVLGWVFGTANIATGTMTTWDFKSYHIRTGLKANNVAVDKITNNAHTDKVFHYTAEKLLKEGVEGKVKVATALLKEAVHLKSDIGSFASLPFPVVSTISPQFARELADYGLDMANTIDIAKQSTYSILINCFIAMAHKCFYNEEMGISKTNYEVKTRKILSYSNLIATTSNVISTAISAYLGDVNASKKLDVGGIFVTIYRLINDNMFIHQVKEEFIFEKFKELID